MRRPTSSTAGTSSARMIPTNRYPSTPANRPGSTAVRGHPRPARRGRSPWPTPPASRTRRRTRRAGTAGTAELNLRHAPQAKPRKISPSAPWNATARPHSSSRTARRKAARARLPTPNSSHSQKRTWYRRRCRSARPSLMDRYALDRHGLEPAAVRGAATGRHHRHTSSPAMFGGYARRTTSPNLSRRSFPHRVHRSYRSPSSVLTHDQWWCRCQRQVRGALVGLSTVVSSSGA